jgi:hypothetical protein
MGADNRLWHHLCPIFVCMCIKTFILTISPATACPGRERTAGRRVIFQKSKKKKKKKKKKKNCAYVNNLGFFFLCDFVIAFQVPH